MGNDQYTRDVAARGLQAVHDRRQANSYGINNRDAALRYLMQSGQSTQQPTGGYQQWHQNRGFQPQQYPIALGQGDGKYAGFKTEGELKAALLGRAESLRGQDQYQADQLNQLADQYLNNAEQMYNKQLSATQQSLQKQTGYNPITAAIAGGADTLNPFSDHSTQRDETKATYDKAFSGQQQHLNEWLAQTTDPYLEALTTAQQIGQTPLRDYATLAGGEYGVDPNIVGGWYPTSSNISDFRNQRDLSALDQFGMTQNEYEQVLAQIAGEQTKQASADQQQYDQQVNDQIFQVTGMDGNQLASQADLNQEQLYNVVASDQYNGLNSQLQQIVQQPDMNEDEMRKAVDDVLSQASADPTLYRVLYAQWGGYGGGN